MGPASGHILVVDDEPSVRESVGYALEQEGFAVTLAEDGEDAEGKLNGAHFDLLILDINIPTLSGLKVFEIMLQKRIDIPALFITGMSGTDVEMQSLEMGAAGFLRKPIRKEVLLPKIRGILQRSQPKAEGGQTTN